MRRRNPPAEIVRASNPESPAGVFIGTIDP
jgi:hypothetical protein